MGSTGSSKSIEARLEAMSFNWFYNQLTNTEQAMTVAFDAYNFTKDASREDDTKVLEQAISKFNLTRPIVVYRGVDAEEFAEMMFNYGDDNLYTTEMKGTSISLSRAEAFAEPRGGYIFEYRVNTGHNGAYFDNGVPGSNEKQFVINRNVKMRVAEVDQKNKRIVIEVGK